MKALLTAIQTAYAGNALATTLGDLYFDQVVEGTAKPYIRYSVISNDLELAFGVKFSLEEVLLQFDIWGVGANTVLGYQDSLHALFDDCSLTLSPATGTEKHIQAIRLRSRILLDGRDENNDEVYRAISEYRFTVHRANP